MIEKERSAIIKRITDQTIQQINNLPDSHVAIEIPYESKLNEQEIVIFIKTIKEHCKGITRCTVDLENITFYKTL